MTPTLLVTGTVGAGKSTIAAQISDLLGEAEIEHAAVDLDVLTWQWPADSQFNADLMFENLAALWPNYQAHGASRLILARVIESRSELLRYRTAVPGAEIVVCRLLVSQEVRIERLRERMPPGPSLDWHEQRTVELEQILDRSPVEDFSVTNNRGPREVALEVLSRARWL